jgi:hypothetical protein
MRGYNIHPNRIEFLNILSSLNLAFMSESPSADRYEIIGPVWSFGLQYPPQPGRIPVI